MIPSCRLPLFLLFFFYWVALAQAQLDSVVVQGKIENLTPRQYRQASRVTVARINVLRADQEIIYPADLQPDGSFRLRLPLVFKHEECFFTYDNLLLPFMASAGELTLRINADSLKKSTAAVVFGGVQAAINQQHTAFYAALNQWLLKQPEFKNPLDKTSRWNAQKAWEFLRNLRERKRQFYENFAANSRDALLDEWVKTALNQEANALFLIHLTNQNLAIPSSLADTLVLDAKPMLTFTKADAFRQFALYAAQNSAQQREVALPVSKVVALATYLAEHLSPADSLKMSELRQQKSIKVKELEWLNKQLEGKEETFQLLSLYELHVKKYAAAYDFASLDFLRTQFYVGNTSQLTIRQLQVLYNYLQPQLKNPAYARSLQEIHQIETRDSLVINALDNLPFVPHRQGNLDNFAIEALSGIYLYQNPLQATESQVASILKMYKGRPIYVLLWDNADAFSRQEFLNAQYLRARLPASVQLVTVCMAGISTQVWKEAVVKSKLKGFHILCSLNAQQDEWLLQMAAEQIPAAMLISERGKTVRNPAPLPGDQEGWEKLLAKSLDLK